MLEVLELILFQVATNFSTVAKSRINVVRGDSSGVVVFISLVLLGGKLKGTVRELGLKLQLSTAPPEPILSSQISALQGDVFHRSFIQWT
jgi:hypothetical protein